MRNIVVYHYKRILIAIIIIGLRIGYTETVIFSLSWMYVLLHKNKIFYNLYNNGVKFLCIHFSIN